MEEAICQTCGDPAAQYVGAYDQTLCQRCELNLEALYESMEARSAEVEELRALMAVKG